ncbi:hypothetical protein BH23GEM6_BH23GEM6_24540 [soil metagenome]
MTRSKSLRCHRFLVALVVLAVSAVSADLLQAQHTGPGEATFITDQAVGPAITTGDQLAGMFADPGPVRSMYCPVAWGIRTSADASFVQLQSAQLRPALFPGATITSRAQQNVLALLTAGPRDAAPVNALTSALAPAHNRQAERAARRLAIESRGLFTVLQQIDPLRPGAVGATRLSRTIGAYNSFVDASSTAFLAQPPEELTAIHAVLNSLVIASLEHADRPANVGVVDDRGLACALPAAPPVAAVVPPVERAIEICLYIDRNFQIVTGLVRPTEGDTLVLVGGERRPFSEVYANANRFAQPAWLTVGDQVTIGTSQYNRFGVSRSVRPGELQHAGQIDGVDYFVMQGERGAPAVVYFPVAPDCEVQPYRAVTTIRVRG